MKLLVNIRIDKEIKKFIEEYASKERRSISNFITNAILTYVQDHHGAEPPDVKSSWESRADKPMDELTVHAPSARYGKKKSR